MLGLCWTYVPSLFVSSDTMLIECACRMSRITLFVDLCVAQISHLFGTFFCCHWVMIGQKLVYFLLVIIFVYIKDGIVLYGLPTFTALDVHYRAYAFLQRAKTLNDLPVVSFAVKYSNEKMHVIVRVLWKVRENLDFTGC